MQFHQYRTFWTHETRRDFIKEVEHSKNIPPAKEAQLNHAVSENAWIIDRRPFYRFWPGLFHAMSKVDLSQIQIRHLQFTLPDNLHTIVIEFPKGVPYEAYDIKAQYMGDDELLQAFSLNSLLIYQSELHLMSQSIKNQVQYKGTSQNVYFGVLCEEDIKGLRCHRSGVIFHEEEMEMTVLEYLENRNSMTENQRGYLGFICRILVVLALLSNDDREIFKRIILAKDKDKFNPDEPDKFWDRAKNNGMYGWDVGKDIPTREELEEYKTTGMFRGKVIPHFRNGSFAIRWTGKGRTVAKVVWIRETIVNKHLATRIPEGYYGDQEPVED
jgi:hypothetical protein